MGLIKEYNDIFKNHGLDFCENRAIVIYSKNNGGKTRLLKQLSKEIYELNREKIFKGEGSIVHINFVSVDRLGLEDNSGVEKVLFDNSAEYYDQKVKMIDDVKRNYYLPIRAFINNNPNMKQKLSSCINNVFGMEDYNETDYKHYSDGIKNVINIVSEMLYFQASYSKDILCNQAIVLIDEIELYLHVSCQAKFINWLFENFKDFRFVFSSHSPVLLARFKNTVFYQIDNSNSKISDNLVLRIIDNQYYQNFDKIYDDFFDLKKYPDEFDSFISYLSECKKNPKSFSATDYKNKISSLRENYGTLNYEINEIAMSFIEDMLKYSEKEAREFYNAINK